MTCHCPTNAISLGHLDAANTLLSPPPIMPQDSKDDRMSRPVANQPGGKGPVEGDLQNISTTLKSLVDEAADLRERAEHGYPLCVREEDVNATELIAATLLRQLAWMRNLSSKAAQLPSDILLLIFTMAQGHKLYPSARGSPFDHMESYDCPYHWLRLTLVCHRWRSVALSSPSLWTTIYLTGKDGCWHTGAKKPHHHYLLPALLQRVGPDAPLSLYATDSQDTAVSGFRECLPHLHRTRHLFLAGFADYPASTPPAPMLRTLALRLYNPSGAWSFDTVGTPLPLLFGGSAPSVHSLAVYGANQLSKTVFGNLRNLYLDTYPYGDFASLISFLAVNPKLEEIVFREMQFHAGKKPEVHRQICGQASLPKLMRLVFDRCHDAATLLSFLQLPEGVFCSFQVERKKPGPGDIAPPDISSLHNLRDLTRFMIHFELNVDDFFTMYAAGRVSAARGGPWFANDDYTLEHVVNGVAAIVRNAEELWLDGPSVYEMDAHRLRSLVHEMPTIQRLFIFVDEDESRSTCLTALLPHGDTVPGPFLSELHVAVSLDSQRLYETLYKVLSLRQSRGVALQHLKIYVRSSTPKAGQKPRSPDVTRLLLEATVAMLTPVTRILELQIDGDLPTMELNPACTWSSSAPWELPSWQVDMEDDSSASEGDDEDDDDDEEEEDEDWY